MDNLFPESMMDETVKPYGIGRAQNWAELIGQFHYPGSGHTPPHSFNNPLNGSMLNNVGNYAIVNVCGCGICVDCEATFYELLHKRL